jgi:hypothetical protein
LQKTYGISSKASGAEITLIQYVLSMVKITKAEASLFLLFLSANFDWDEATNSIQGELPENAEQFILNCISRLSLLTDFYLQEQLEEGILKYKEVQDYSTSIADIIQYCAPALLQSPEDRDAVYYLCSEIIYLNGQIKEDSKEDKYLNKLCYYLKVDSSFSNAVFFIEIVNSALKS